jgi:hypothetical protein
MAIIAQESAAQIAANDAALKSQLSAVQHQSDSQNALELAIRVKAGWDTIHNVWTAKEPTPVTIRMRNTQKILTLGYEPARHSVMSGVADLV